MAKNKERELFNPIFQSVVIGGHEFTVTALPLGVMRREIGSMVSRAAESGALDSDVLNDILRFTHMSVSKADPDITVDDLENSLTLGDILDLFHAVMRVSGMTRGGSNQGEAPRQPRLNEAGETSTATSQPAQDGHLAISTPS